MSLTHDEIRSDTATAVRDPRSSVESAYDPADWHSVRDQFLLDRELVHLSNFYLASNPTPVRDAITRYRRAFDEDPHGFLHDHMFSREQDMLWRRSASAAADYVGGQLSEIALTTSTTMGLALIYNGIRLNPGEEVLTTTHEFYPHHEAIRLACVKSGAQMRTISLYDSSADFSVDDAVARLLAQIRPNTRIFGVAWVHSGNGVRLPVSRVAAAIAQVNATRSEDERVLLVIDGVHGFGVADEDVAAMGCDFFAAGTHKWILGPRGTGIAWASASAWARLQPTIPSLMTKEPADAWRQDRAPRGPVAGPWVSPGGFFSYEHQWAMAEAFEFCQGIGRRRIQDRIAELNGRIKAGLAQMRHVTLYTPRDPDVSAGIVVFDVHGRDPREVVQTLRERRVIASVTPYAPPRVRLSAGIVNFPEEIDLALEVIDSLG